MQRYALLQSGKVELVVEQSAPPTVPGNWVLSPEWVSPSDSYNGFAFEKVQLNEIRHITKYAFKARMTSAERIAIREAAKANAVVYDFLDLADSAVYIDLNLPSTRAGVQALESLGLLAAGRALEILDNPIQAIERSPDAISFR